MGKGSSFRRIVEVGKAIIGIDTVINGVLQPPGPVGGDFNSLKPADVVLTSRIREGWIGRAIRWATRVKGEPRTEASHVAMVHHVIPPGKSPSNVVLIEQTYPRVRMGTLADYGQSRYWVARNINLIDRECAAILAAAESLPEKHYGLLKLPLFFIDGLIGKGLNWIRYGAYKLFGIWEKPWRLPILSRLDFLKSLVCSQFVAWVYEKGAYPRNNMGSAFDKDGKFIKYHFGGPPLTRTPDDIDDWVRSQRGHDLGWRIVLTRSA